MEQRANTTVTHAAVITADMVNSTHFSQQQTGKWLTELAELLRSSISDWLLLPEIYRGDSFQAVLATPAQALHTAVLARASMKARSQETDLRIALGIGSVSRLTDRPGTSDGEAFRLSGQTADIMRKQRARIALALPYPAEPLQHTLNLLETLIESWSMAQSEVIVHLLTGKSAGEIAETLSISQSAVSQRIASAKWWALEPFIKTFPDLIQPYNSHG